MKKSTMLLLLLGFFTIGTFAQTTADAKTVTGKDVALMNIPMLKKLSDKVNAAYAKTLMVSRTGSASAHDEYVIQLDAYLAELNSQAKANANDQALAKIIQTEIDNVNQLKAAGNPIKKSN
jgi:hypothetical protein